VLRQGRFKQTLEWQVLCLPLFFGNRLLIYVERKLAFARLFLSTVD
jgi:hypothetical protein